MTRQWSGHYAQRVLAWLWSTSPHLCSLCGQPITAGPGARLADGRRDPMRASVDHTLARSRGGTDSPANLRLAHLSCNSAKGARAATSRARRVIDQRAFFSA